MSFWHYQPQLLRYFQRRVPELAEDLTSETLIRAHTRRYVEDGKPLYWLYRVAHNLMVDTLRYRSYRVTTELAEDLHPHYQDPGYDMVEARELLEATTPRRALAISMTAAGYNSQEIAEHTGQTASGVRIDIMRGRQAIRTQEESYESR